MMSEHDAPADRRPAVVWVPLVLGLVGAALVAVLAVLGSPGPVLTTALLNGIAVSGFLILAGLIVLRSPRLRLIPVWLAWLWLGIFGVASGVVAISNLAEIRAYAHIASPGRETQLVLSLLIFGPLVGLTGFAFFVALLVGRVRHPKPQHCRTTDSATADSATVLPATMPAAPAVAGIIDLASIIGFAALLPRTQQVIADHGPMLWSWAILALGLTCGTLIALGARQTIAEYASATAPLGQRIQAALVILAPLFAAISIAITVGWYVWR